MDPRREPEDNGGGREPELAGQPVQERAEPIPSHPATTQTETRRSPPRPQTSSTISKFEDDPLPLPELHRDRGVHGPLPPLPQARVAGGEGRLPMLRTVDSHLSGGPRSGIDWIVPVDHDKLRRHTVGERLQPTLDTAIEEKNKYAIKARLTGYALNVAIGLQVIMGSLITGLSASSTGKSSSLKTTILGGLNTFVAAYLARARGSNEPELSITRVKDLEQFIRECQAFQLDHGHVNTGEFDPQLIGFRRHFEQLLGNASGERKLSPPV